MINFIQRIFSGAIYIALIVAAILLLDNSPVMYLTVFSLSILTLPSFPPFASIIPNFAKSSIVERRPAPPDSQCACSG